MTPNPAHLKTFAAALAMGIGAIAPLSAAMAEMPATAEIRTADLDLATLAGREELDRRITGAAQRLCRGDAATGSRLVDRAAMRDCVASVRRQVHSRMAINVAPAHFDR